jgi:hypothetical protein
MIAACMIMILVLHKYSFLAYFLTTRVCVVLDLCSKQTARNTPRPNAATQKSP